MNKVIYNGYPDRLKPFNKKRKPKYYKRRVEYTYYLILMNCGFIPEINHKPKGYNMSSITNVRYMNFNIPEDHLNQECYIFPLKTCRERAEEYMEFIQGVFDDEQ